MKKKWIALFALVSMCALPMASCSKAENPISSKTTTKDDAKPVSLSIEQMPTKTKYVVGQKFSKTGMKIACAMDDGTTKTLKNSDITITPDRALELTDKKVTATYKNLSVDINITVEEKKLESLVITTPAQTTIGVNDAYDFSGLAVKAHYNDGSEDVELTEEQYTLSINGNTVKATDICTLAVGKYKVVAAYQTLTASFEITVVTKTIKEIKYTDPTSTTFAKGSKYDFTSFKAHVTYVEDGLAEEDLKESRLKFTINSVEVKSGDVIALDAGTYQVKAEVLRTETAYTHEFAINIFEGYKIEAEKITDTADEEIQASSDTYVRGKKNASDADYLPYHEGKGSPLSAFYDSDTASGGYLGEIKGGSYIEFHFKSEIERQATVTITAASAWLRKDTNWTPLWMGDLPLNKVFSSTANGNPINIGDDVILPGSGSEDNETTGIATWTSWKSVDFGTMNLKKGWNTVTMEIKAQDELADFVNSHGGYTIMNLDFIQVNFVK